MKAQSVSSLSRDLTALTKRVTALEASNKALVADTAVKGKSIAALIAQNSALNNTMVEVLKHQTEIYAQLGTLDTRQKQLFDTIPKLKNNVVLKGFTSIIKVGDTTIITK